MRLPTSACCGLGRLEGLTATMAQEVSEGVLRVRKVGEVKGDHGAGGERACVVALTLYWRKYRPFTRSWNT